MSSVPPLIEIAIEPKNKGNREMMVAALRKLAAEDPSFGISIDNLSGQIVISGMSEHHLGAKLDRLRRVYEISVDVGAPQVAYRETITHKSEISHTYKKQIGSAGEFARVKIRFEPLPPGSGVVFENEVIGGRVPKEYIPGVEKGIIKAAETGILAGFPMIDFKATLMDGAYHDVDSSVLAFEIAAGACFREGIAKAGPVLLEPVMRVEVVAPEDYIGDIIGDLNNRRGRVTGVDQRGDSCVVSAVVPLANMLGYGETLESLSRGRTMFRMEFSHYDPTPSPNDRGPFRPAIGMRA